MAKLKITNSNNRRVLVRIQLAADLDAETGKAAAQAGLSQPTFLGLCIRYGFPSARAAALGQTSQEAK